MIITGLYHVINDYMSPVFPHNHLPLGGQGS